MKKKKPRKTERLNGNQKVSLRKRRNDEAREQSFCMIETLLDEGYKRSQIVQVLTKQYEISYRQAQRDVDEVIQSRRILASPTEEISEITHQNKYLWRKLMEQKDYQTANKVLDSRFKYITEGGNNDVSHSQKPNLQRELDAFHQKLKKKPPQ